ncbi:hypothetical protein [Vibrio minamisatsumaniensis]|uniref:hypothetical protein n=1 Tax=Vibrio minamisatsumaniensis TaxID=2910243 RepID=UPI003D194F5A
MNQEQLDDEVVRQFTILTQLIEHQGDALSDDFWHVSRQKLLDSQHKDHISRLYKSLLQLGLDAKKCHLKLPDTLAYFLIEQLEVLIVGEEEATLLKQVMKHDTEQDSISESRKYTDIIMQIIWGHMKAQMGETLEVEGSLDAFLSGNGMAKYRIEPVDYGYLLGLKKKKLTVSDAKIFYELYLNQSSSNVGKLFTKYNLSGAIKGYKA